MAQNTKSKESFLKWLILPILVAIIAALGPIIAEMINSGFLVLTLTESPVPASTNTESKYLIYEHFDDGVVDDLRILSGVWSIVDEGNGNKVFQSNSMGDSWSNITFGSRAYKDYTIKYRFRYIEGDGLMYLAFRGNQEGAYFLANDSHWNIFNLNYGFDWVNLGEYLYDFQGNVWYSVRVEVYGTHIKVFLDEKLIYSLEDSFSSKGDISLQTESNIIAQFDDITVSQ